MCISLVIPVYNTPPQWLTDCLHGIAEQTIAPYEILVVDDGSDSPETLQVLSSLPHHIRMERLEKNQGLSAAMNHALHSARGKYMLKVDSDDIPRRRLVENHIRGTRAWKDATVIGCQIEAFGSTSYRTQFPEHVTARSLALSKFAWQVSNTGVLLSVERVKNVGGWREGRRGLSEDLELWVEILEAGGKMYNLPEILLDYRVSGGSLRVGNENEKNKEFVAGLRRRLAQAAGI